MEQNGIIPLGNYKSTMFESDENWGKWRITGIPSLKVTKLK